MPVYVSGSLAFDRIMAFNGNFQDHVLMDKLHMLNISFMVSSMAERRGGCAGNIAYTLALLGGEPLLVSCAGSDFANNNANFTNSTRQTTSRCARTSIMSSTIGMIG